MMRQFLTCTLVCFLSMAFFVGLSGGSAVKAAAHTMVSTSACTDGQAGRQVTYGTADALQSIWGDGGPSIQPYRGLHPASPRSQGATAQLMTPSAVFRGCYTGLTAYSDCELAGLDGVDNGSWLWYVCDSRYCPQGGIGLVTER